MTPKDVLDKLLTQHESLRVLMDECEQLADELDARGGPPTQLLPRVAQLRVAFEAHNKFEESVLPPILRDADAFGDVRIERMVADHVGEHRAMHDRLAAGPTAELRATIARLREHLATEERYFLSSRIVRDDLVVVEGGG